MKKIKAILMSDAPRYICSSLIAFAINYATVWFLESLLGFMKFGLELAMIVGWLLSSHVNFLINRTFVFRSKGRILPAYLKYYSLALPVFLVKNFGFMELLYRLLHLKVSIAYPIAEALMFVVTYLVQKKLVFRQKKDGLPKAAAENSDIQKPKK